MLFTAQVSTYVVASGDGLVQVLDAIVRVGASKLCSLLRQDVLDALVGLHWGAGIRGERWVDDIAEGRSSATELPDVRC